MKRKHTRFVKDQLTTNFKRTYPVILLVILAFFVLQFLVTVFSTASPNALNSGVFYQLFGNSFSDFFDANKALTFFAPYADPNFSSLQAFNFVFALPFMVMQCVSKELAITMYFIVEILMLVILVMAAKQKMNLSVKTTACLTAVCLLSAPFLFLLERGSYLFFALFFVAVFFLCKDSDRTWLREIAIISLAVASAMQIHLIVFAIFLLKDKRFKELLRFALYTVVLFFVPFFMFSGGFAQNVGLFFANAFAGSDMLSSDVSFTNLFRMVAYIFGLDYLNSIFNIVILILKIGLALCLVVALFGSREKWKTMAMCALLCVVLPHPAMEYNLVFLLIAFIAFLQQPKYEQIDIFYVVLFTLIFIPYQFGFIIWPTTFPAQYAGISAFDPNYLGLTVNIFISALAATVLTIALVVDAIKKLPQRHIALKEFEKEDVDEDEDD